MNIAELASAYPAPFILTLRTCHMIASFCFLDSHLTLWAIGKIRLSEPFIICHPGVNVTTFETLVSDPFDLAFTTEFKGTVLTLCDCHLLFVTFSNLGALGIRTVHSVLTKGNI